MSQVRRALAVSALFALLFAWSAASAEEAASTTYTFGTFEARTNVTFLSEADLETIQGIGHVISGSVTWDPKTSSATGRLAVPVKDMHTGIDKRDAHMRGEQGGTWLEAAKYPEIVFELTKTVPTKDVPNRVDYEGRLTIHGVTKPWKGAATLRFIPASVAGPAKLGDGDWVRVKTSFDVPIQDFGVEIPQGVGPKVSAVWKISIDLYGTTVPPKK